MRNNNISAKKKFGILLKLMKNNKHTQTPPLREGQNSINDPQEKSELFNKYFPEKASIQNPEDEPPILPRMNGILDLDSINTSPIELSKIIKTNLKKILHTGDKASLHRCE